MSRPFHHPSVGQPAAVLSVSELNDIIRDRLETGLDALWVAGELSNVRFAPSGHVYFTLKDSESQIAAVLFRRNAERLRFRLEDGMEVVCSGRVGLYTVRGALQFYAVEVEARGKGALTVAFEQLKKRLWQEGLFESERKKPLPFLPRTVGIVTSLQGAAVRDMLSIIGERFPERRVIIRPVKVQGQGAALEIAQG
ncbi:MAG: exodeoxyribonuclease VII large subunit, partial [Deltaproteobacteria bacterium]|nr:exodeoxyribonuclease VII large subunit [Deltaproteobacteria bacterium]